MGYTNTQSIIDRNGTELQISGKLLAQLLVKGLYTHAQRYIEEMCRNPETMKGRISHLADPFDIENQYLMAKE